MDTDILLELLVEFIIGSPWILLFMGMGLLFMLGAMGNYRLAQLIKNIPTSNVGSAAVGLVEIKGRSRTKEPLTSPVTQQKCIYYKVEVETTGKNSTTLYKDEKVVPFSIEDDTGSVRVDTAGALEPPENVKNRKPSFGAKLQQAQKVTFYVEKDYEGKGYLPWGKYADKKVILDAKGIDFISNRLPEEIREKIRSGYDSIYLQRPLKITEYCIPEGKEVYVLGEYVVREDGPVITNGSEGICYVSESKEEKLVNDLIKGAVGYALLGLFLQLFVLGAFLKKIL